MELEDGYTRDGSSGTGTEIAYTVEARNNYIDPRQVGGQIFDNRWRRVIFHRDVIGVPQCDRHNRHTREHGMLGYQAAQALRWWVHATAEAERMAICLETRIIKHTIEYSYKITAVSAHEMIGGEDRSNYMPDWGKEDLDSPPQT